MTDALVSRADRAVRQARRDPVIAVPSVGRSEAHAGACEGRRARQRAALDELLAMDLPDVSLQDFVEGGRGGMATGVAGGCKNGAGDASEGRETASQIERGRL